MGKSKSLLSRIVVPVVEVAKHNIKSPMTHKYPFERQKGFERTRGRHVLYIDKCIGCGVCAWICPVNAIKMVEVEGSKYTHPRIDYGRCCYCGLCVEYCPRRALVHTPIVEVTSESRDDLIYDPKKLSVKPNIKEILPELKYELEPVIDAKYGIRYIRRRIT